MRCNTISNWIVLCSGYVNSPILFGWAPLCAYISYVFLERDCKYWGGAAYLGRCKSCVYPESHGRKRVHRTSIDELRRLGVERMLFLYSSWGDIEPDKFLKLNSVVTGHQD